MKTKLEVEEESNMNHAMDDIDVAAQIVETTHL
jgi:hypothetical protein